MNAAQPDSGERGGLRKARVREISFLFVAAEAVGEKVMRSDGVVNW